jgi:hypothetical protein
MIRVVDVNSNKNDNISHAAEFLGRSKWKRAIFEEIYRGKPKPKTADDIRRKVRARNDRLVLTIGNELVKAGMVEQKKVDGRVAYEKFGWLDQLKRRILNYAANPNALAKLPTKTNPKGSNGPSVVRLKLWGKATDTRELTLDDIDSFAKVRRVKKVPASRLAIPETAFKEGVKKIIGETGRFVDRPDERNDLLSNRVVYRGKRIASAFAFKGPGKRKVLLEPSDMGKHGDQIQKLFNSPADLFILQYWSQVSERLREMVVSYAEIRSGHYAKRVYYCIIDGKDSDRLALAYRTAFDLADD